MKTSAVCIAMEGGITLLPQRSKRPCKTSNLNKPTTFPLPKIGTIDAYKIAKTTLVLTTMICTRFEKKVITRQRMSPSALKPPAPHINILLFNTKMS